MIQRHKTHAVKVGHITMGGNTPVVVQSMTDTDTANIDETVNQIRSLTKAGSEIVRITVNSEAAAAAIPSIYEKLASHNCTTPIVGDFHYNGHSLLTQYPETAQLLHKYRINPGNVGFGNKKDAQFQMIIETALKYDKPVRIGVNWGSLDKSLLTELMNENSKLKHPKHAQAVLHEALVVSALSSAQMAVNLGMKENKIILSCKVSRIPDLIKVYTMLSERSRYALHLGLTEAGMGDKGIIASSLGIGLLLQQGIGDTIRSSLTPEPKGSRDREVTVCQQILQALNIRSFAPEVTACPGCGRTNSDFFRVLTDEIDLFLRQNMSQWRTQYRNVESMRVAVMGCIVNGPGESKHANIGISLPGTGESPAAPVFINGQKTTTLRGNNIPEQFKNIIENYVQEHYSTHNNIIHQQ